MRILRARLTGLSKTGDNERGNAPRMMAAMISAPNMPSSSRFACEMLKSAPCATSAAPVCENVGMRLAERGDSTSASLSSCIPLLYVRYTASTPCSARREWQFCKRCAASNVSSISKISLQRSSSTPSSRAALSISPRAMLPRPAGVSS